MAQTVYPTFRYRDAHAAMEWLESVLGFTRSNVYPGEGDAVAHAQLAFDGGMIMLGTGDDDRTGWTYLVSADPAGAYRRARDAGAEVVHELQETDYGSTEFTVKDPEGNLWSIGSYQPAEEA